MCKEQIEKQAIEEMAKVIEKTEQIARDAHCGLPSPNMYAKDLYWHGYRKQSEGEWHYNPDGMDWGLGAWQCSLCCCRNDNLPMDKNIKPLRWAGSKYCPNCGAKMKGGAE